MAACSQTQIVAKAKEAPRTDKMGPLMVVIFKYRLLQVQNHFFFSINIFFKNLNNVFVENLNWLPVIWKF